MVFKSIRKILIFSFITALFITLLPQERVHAWGKFPLTGDLPRLNVFISQVRNGEAGELRGVYIPELLAVQVVQQPTGNPEFVSPWGNILTQFSLASPFGSTGLLAHNYMAGEAFSLLRKDQKIYLVFGDGEVASYVVTETRRYQALEPDSTSSQFVNLENSALLTTSELFSEVYDRPGNVIFQTCISRDDDLTWGRLFVIAEPSATP